jgi:tetratricopeptide repeat protein 21B
MFDDAIQQLEFVEENLANQQKHPELCYLESIIEWRVKSNKIGAISHLDTSLNLHIQQTKSS